MKIDLFIDKEDAINRLGNNVEMFYMLLGNLENSSLNQTMEQMVTAYNDRDYPKMNGLAQTLKGASSYVGAGRMHYITYFIQKNFEMKNYDQMLEYYPSLVEAAIEFKVESRKLIAKHKN